MKLTGIAECIMWLRELDPNISADRLSYYVSQNCHVKFTKAECEHLIRSYNNSSKDNTDFKEVIQCQLF